MSELPDNAKNHFLRRRNFPKAQKIIFEGFGTSRQCKKSFSETSELSESSKKHFLRRRNFPKASKSIFDVFRKSGKR